MNDTIIKSIETITGKSKLPSNASLNRKLNLIGKHLNPSKYEVLGFVDRSNDVVLRPKYYNVRNSIGRFASIVD